MNLNKLFTDEKQFQEIMMGNHAIVRGMVEAGVRVVTSYPGSPTPEIAGAIALVNKEKHPMYFEFSVNEKVALEVAFGASVNGYLSTVFFKSVGINVAADSFVQLSMMELIGGMVIILGDDPGANSSQNEQDNRHFAKLSYTPVFEPATAQEAYQMFKEAANLSQRKKMPVVLRLTTHVCHAKEKINFSAFKEQPFKENPSFDKRNGPYVPIAKEVSPLKRKALQKLSEVDLEADKNPSYVKLDNNKNKNHGVITMGLPYLSLLDAINDSEAKPDILKLNLIYPLPKASILRFLKEHKEVKILEELDPVLEADIKALAYENSLGTRIIGKNDIEDFLGEYTPEKVRSILHKTWPNIFRDVSTIQGNPTLSPRPPQLCPGCGHRSAFYAVKQALAETDITVGDIGCHSLGFLPPYQMGEILLCMGHSTGTASGLALFNNSRKVVSFLGDSTFFHAGIPGVINSIFNKHNHTLIIMENNTTAMTGHQDLPSTGKNFNGETVKIPLRKILEGIGVTDIMEIDAYNQKGLTDLVKKSASKDGFKIIIAKHPCMLKSTREKRKDGKSIPSAVQINDKCDKQQKCVKNFACPTYQLKEDGNVTVQKELCIGDLSCIQTCPTKAIEKGGN